jgi:hypothetical protein
MASAAGAVRSLTAEPSTRGIDEIKIDSVTVGVTPEV